MQLDKVIAKLIKGCSVCYSVCVICSRTDTYRVIFKKKQSKELNETIGEPAIFTRNSFEVLSVCHIVSGED